MADGGNNRKLNLELVSPETNQAKKYQESSSPLASDNGFSSLPGARYPYCCEACLPESRAAQHDPCGMWAHAVCEGISDELYGEFSDVCIIYYIIVWLVIATAILRNLYMLT